jgi:hypothetical protein
MTRLLLSVAGAAVLIAAPAMADPYGVNRPSDYELFKKDVRIAQKHAHKPSTPNSVPGYSFKLLTMRNDGRFSSVKSAPFGVYASLQECDMARARKLAELDATDLRHPHYLPGAQMVPTTTTTSSRSSNFGFGQGTGLGTGSTSDGNNYTNFGQGTHMTARTNDQTSSTTSSTMVGTIEFMGATFCEPGIFSPVPTSNPAIARVAP